MFYPEENLLPSANNARNGNVDTGCIRAGIAQKVDVGTTKLTGISQARHAAVVLHLQVPIGGGLDVVGHGSADEAGGDAVDADTVLAPFHGEGVAHVAN